MDTLAEGVIPGSVEKIAAEFFKKNQRIIVHDEIVKIPRKDWWNGSKEPPFAEVYAFHQRLKKLVWMEAQKAQESVLASA